MSKDKDIEKIVEQACNERPYQWQYRSQTDRLDVMEIARRAAELAVAGERERAAKVVDGWHIKKGGYTTLASAIRAGKEGGT